MPWKIISEFNELVAEIDSSSEIVEAWRINHGPDILIETQNELRISIAFWEKVVTAARLGGSSGPIVLSGFLLLNPRELVIRRPRNETWTNVDISSLLDVSIRFQSLRKLELVRIPVPFHIFFHALSFMDDLEVVILDNIVCDFITHDSIPWGSDPVFLRNVHLTIKGKYTYDVINATYDLVPILRMLCCVHVKECALDGASVSAICDTLTSQSPEADPRLLFRFSFQLTAYILPDVHLLTVELLNTEDEFSLRQLAARIRRLIKAISGTLKTLEVVSDHDIDEVVQREFYPTVQYYSGPLSFFNIFLHPHTSLHCVHISSPIDDIITLTRMLRPLIPVPQIRTLRLNAIRCCFEFVQMIGKLFPNLRSLTISHTAGEFDQYDFKAIGRYVLKKMDHIATFKLYTEAETCYSTSVLQTIIDGWRIDSLVCVQLDKKTLFTRDNKSVPWQRTII
ncbi:hypothetical protein V5O48_002179 [Marasmius crinis-equi]|uniref:F-box domain-containing protein n=1 Tax=Marasmius crinis-equi TaxID=585013 RepID=A0ABR3FWG9_9AGAR